MDTMATAVETLSLLCSEDSSGGRCFGRQGRQQIARDSGTSPPPASHCPSRSKSEIKYLHRSYVPDEAVQQMVTPQAMRMTYLLHGAGAIALRHHAVAVRNMQH